MSENQIRQIRSVSRTLVRELGFTGANFAGTDLSPSAVHALIEIEQGGMTARELGLRLGLEKSSVSRMLRRLIDAALVLEEQASADARLKVLSLTSAGQSRVRDIHAFGNAQVSAALSHLSKDQAETVLRGLRLYGEALGGGNMTSAASPKAEIVRGYQTGLIADITGLHARYYARTSGFGQRFESVVAGGMAEFCNRLESPKNAIWTARAGGETLGSIAIDGEDMGDGKAHLRWFITSDSVRGSGIGRKLLSEALTFVDQQGFSETHLWTFSGLHAARHLYEASGFVLREESPGSQWGKEVTEQLFVRGRS